MRISTSIIYSTGVVAMQNQQAALIKTQEQVATGRRVLTPEDDPVAASSILDMSQSMSVTQQYKTNADSAKGSLELEESVLSSVTDLIQNMKALTVSAGNPTLSASDRARIAVEVNANYQQLLGLANQKDGKGQYIFSGYKGATQPFTQTSGAGAYVGDLGQRKVQISPSRQIETSDTGSDVFKPGVAGQDLFQTLDNFATALNSGTLPAANLDAALNGLSSSLDNVLKVRASVGSRLREIDSTQNTGDELRLNYEQSISNMRDVDYAKAITDLTQQQMYLEAAQKSFLKVSGLSLFNLM